MYTQYIILIIPNMYDVYAKNTCDAACVHAQLTLHIYYINLTHVLQHVGVPNYPTLIILPLRAWI